MHSNYIKAVFAYILILSCLAHPVISHAAEETISDQPGGTLKRIISRISTTRESVMLGAACDTGTITFNRGEAACSRCPSYTGQAGDAGAFTIESIITGTFLKPNANEALLNMSGCESRADASGGIILLRQGKGGWNRIWYQPGHRLTDCLNFRTTSNLVSLLCNRSDIAHGIETGELVWVIPGDEGLIVHPLITWQDNIQSNPRDLLVIYPSRMLRSDFNQDGRADVRVTFRLLEHRIPTKYGGALDAIAQNYPLPEAQKLGVIYLFDGTNLVPHTTSEPAIKTIRALLHKHTRESGE